MVVLLLLPRRLLPVPRRPRTSTSQRLANKHVRRRNHSNSGRSPRPKPASTLVDPLPRVRTPRRNSRPPGTPWHHPQHGPHTARHPLQLRTTHHPLQRTAHRVLRMPLLGPGRRRRQQQRPVRTTVPPHLRTVPRHKPPPPASQQPRTRPPLCNPLRRCMRRRTTHRRPPPRARPRRRGRTCPRFWTTSMKSSKCWCVVALRRCLVVAVMLRGRVVVGVP